MKGCLLHGHSDPNVILYKGAWKVGAAGRELHARRALAPLWQVLATPRFDPVEELLLVLSLQGGCEGSV